MLPKPGDPLNVNGKVIAPVNGVESFVEIESNINTQRYIASKKRKLNDLPVLPKEMNTLSVILVYSLLGVSDVEISLATGIDIESIGRVRKVEGYNKILGELLSEVAEANKETVRGIMFDSAVDAAKTQVELLNHPHPVIKQKAAMDILDRTGNRAVDVVEHNHKMSGGLVIEVIHKGNNESLPTIDITPTKES